MNRQTLDVLVRNAELARSLPLPNYFDSQRFGSLRGAPRGAGSTTAAAGAPAYAAPAFDIVEALRGNHEKALKNILTGTYRKEQSRIKALKRALSESWGNWPRCVEIATAARYENYSEIFSNLGEKNDFMEALGLVRDQRLRMGALALQSWLWNEAVKARLVHEMGTGNLTAVQYEAGELLFPKLGGMALKEYRVFAEGLKGRRLPMPHPGMVDRGEYERFLDGMGLELRQLEGLGELGVSLSKEERPMFLTLSDLELSGRGEEDLKAQRRFWATLRFGLPAGSYATVIVKALAG
jgi:tRNA(Glu) U13 pseudouridine synthase TruD